MAYTITFDTGGGSSVAPLTEQTALPNPLPTTTKANHVFAGWYYDNLFTQKANAGDELTANVTLYAKWYTPTTWCEDIADAIREKEGSSEPIKHVDFPDRIRELDGADLSRVMPIAFQLYTFKPTGSMTLKYIIGSSMLDKRFFFDINGNSYLPSQVSVYFDDTLKGNANQNITLTSTSSQQSGQMVTFKVGTLEVGIPTYYYNGSREAFQTGIHTEGVIAIGWSNATGTNVSPLMESVRFIQAPNDLFDNFPYYNILNYWKADNMLAAMTIDYTYVFRVGWEANDPD